jgi:hypothetical protein
MSLLQHDIASEFQRRRQITRQLEMPWIWVLIAGWIGVVTVFYAESLAPRTAAGLFLVSLMAVGVSTVRINFIAISTPCRAMGSQDRLRDGVTRKGSYAPAGVLENHSSS